MPGMTSSGSYNLAEDCVNDDVELQVKAMAPRKPSPSKRGASDVKRPSGYGRPGNTAAGAAAQVTSARSEPRTRRNLQDAKMQDNNVDLDSEMTRLYSQVDAYRYWQQPSSSCHL